MACEASRRSREGSPFIPGLIWRFCSPWFFAANAIGNCSYCASAIAICGEKLREAKPVSRA